MTGRIFAVALLAGLAAGLAVSVLQHFTTTPLILHAEQFETKGADLGAGGGGHAPVDLNARGLGDARLFWPMPAANMPRTAMKPKPGGPKTAWSARFSPH